MCMYVYMYVAVEFLDLQWNSIDLYDGILNLYIFIYAIIYNKILYQYSIFNNVSMFLGTSNVE